jgi:protein gp37
MSKSKIEWTEATWNPSTGCTKISAGCTNCYAEKMALRLKAMGLTKYKDGFKLSLHPTLLNEPYSWKNPKLVFVNSMSDLFHEAIPQDFIMSVFKVMNDNPQHSFQILTKRPQNLSKFNYLLDWTSNIWMGATIEDYTHIDRLDYLKSCDASIKFLSLEPLLTKLPPLDLIGIDWIIVGGESGPNARPMKREWVISIKDNCKAYGVPFFFKQWGGKNKKKAGRLLDGRFYDQMPEIRLANDLSIIQ